jgi:thiol-disulfide isomerase/thioredoxin
MTSSRNTKLAALFAICLLADAIDSNGQTSGKKNGSIKTDLLQFRIHIEGFAASDSLYIAQYRHFFNRETPDEIIGAGKNNNAIYVFLITSVSQPRYVSFFNDLSSNKTPSYFLDLYEAEPGDNITIEIKKDSSLKDLITPGQTYPACHFTNSKIRFYGKGAAKYQCRYNISRAIYADINSFKAFDLTGKSIPHNHYQISKAIIRNELEKYKGKMSAAAADLIAIDFFSKIEMERLDNFYYNLNDDSSLKNFSKEFYLNNKSVEKQFLQFSKNFSSGYFQFIVKRATKKIPWARNNKYGINVDSIYWGLYLSLKAQYEGELKDKIISLLSMKLQGPEYGQHILDDAMVSVKTEYFIDILRSFADANSVGKLAYNFSLTDTKGRIVRLEDFKGRVVFIDFWFNGCRACAIYYKLVISKVEEKFRNNSQVVFIAVNVDTDEKRWLDGIKEGLYTSASVVNLNTNGKGQSHPIIKHYNVMSYPRPLLIGRDGKIMSNHEDQLRGKGVNGLAEMINKALEIEEASVK